MKLVVAPRVRSGGCGVTGVDLVLPCPDVLETPGVVVLIRAEILISSILVPLHSQSSLTDTKF